MSEEEEEEKGTIDSAINVLDKYIEHNRSAARMVLVYLTVFSLILAALLAYIYLTSSLPQSLHYILAGIFVVVFGVVMAVYRFRLNEIAKATHYKIGFMRIRVAANNFNRQGFHTEVRQSLTERAFDYSASSLLSSKGKQVESPLPGHPTSDISAMFLNKLLEGFELKKKA